MNKMKRIMSMLLIIVMTFSMVHVSASTTEFTGIELRVQEISPDVTVSDAKVTIKAATDEQASIYESTDDITMSGQWYHVINRENYIPEGKESLYIKQELFDGFELYFRPMDDSEKFDFISTFEGSYIFVANISTKNNTTISSNCVFSPMDGDCYVKSLTPTSVTVSIATVPVERVNTIQNIKFTCTNKGEYEIKEYKQDWQYVYYTRNGSFDIDVLQGPIGQPVGTASVNKAEFKELYNVIDLKDNPQVVVAAVDKYEWDYFKTAKVYGYSVYTVPMSSPYITVDSFEFGKEPNILDVGTTQNGKYHADIAQAAFEGWFLDKEGTKPATAEQDAYAIFNLRSYGLFIDGIKASDFVLNTPTEAFYGEHLISQTESNAYKVAFFLPSDRVSVSLQVVGGEGYMYFEYPGQDTITVSPHPQGGYGAKDFHIVIKPGYYGKSLKVNGEEWIDNRNPFTKYETHRIFSNEDFRDWVPSFKITGNTVITLELGLADVITFDYGDTTPSYSNQPLRWHDENKYYASEISRTELCAHYAFVTPPDYSKQVLMLNTKPDGSGIPIIFDGGLENYVWKPLPEFQNGKVDYITLYPIMWCEAHYAAGHIDDSWIYYDAKEASCTEEGNREYRYCPDCGVYQAKKDGVHKDEYFYAFEHEYWSDFTPYCEIVIPKKAHNHEIYTDNGDGTHSIKCTECDDVITETHKIEDGNCICGKNEFLVGDIDKDGVVSDADAVYLLYHTIFPEDYPVNQPVDYDKDGVVSDADAVYLLYYTIFPEDYPLK